MNKRQQIKEEIRIFKQAQRSQRVPQEMRQAMAEMTVDELKEELEVSVFGDVQKLVRAELKRRRRAGRA